MVTSITHDVTTPGTGGVAGVCLTTARSASRVTATAEVDVSFADEGSGSAPATDAVLLMVAPSARPEASVIAMLRLVLAPSFKSGAGHETIPPLSVHPGVELAGSKVAPDGNASDTTIPEASDGPRLLT